MLDEHPLPCRPLAPPVVVNTADLHTAPGVDVLLFCARDEHAHGDADRSHGPNSGAPSADSSPRQHSGQLAYVLLHYEAQPNSNSWLHMLLVVVVVAVPVALAIRRAAQAESSNSNIQQAPKSRHE